MRMTLTDEFLNRYPKNPEGLEDRHIKLGIAHKISDTEYESWHDICTRYVEANMSDALNWMDSWKVKYPMDKVMMEAETLFDNIFHLRQLPSVGTLKNAMGMFNTKIYDSKVMKVSDWRGVTGVIDAINQHSKVSVVIDKMESSFLSFNPDVEIVHLLDAHSEAPYVITTFEQKRGVMTIRVGNTLPEITEFLHVLVHTLTRVYGDPKKIIVDYGQMKVEHRDSLKAFVTSFMELIKSEETTEYEDGLYVFARPSHAFHFISLYRVCIDEMMNRTSQVQFVMDASDVECLVEFKEPSFLLVDSEDEQEIKTHLEYALLFKYGVINKKRMEALTPHAVGVALDGASLLAHKRYSTNVTVNASAFVKELEDRNELDYSGIMQAMALAVRSAIRSNLYGSDEQAHDNPISASVIGWADMVEKLNYSLHQEEALLELLAECARIESLKYAKTLRTTIPITETALPLEDDLAELANVSSGVAYKEPQTIENHIARLSAYQGFSSQGVVLPLYLEQEEGTREERLEKVVDAFAKDFDKFTVLHLSSYSEPEEEHDETGTGSEEAQLTHHG